MKLEMGSLLVIALVVSSVSADLFQEINDCSEYKCNPDDCPKDECHCGTHKQFCGCCDTCLKCLDEYCNPWMGEDCGASYECKLDDPYDSFADKLGKCRPKSA